jgi:hypothetical protein
MNKIQIITASDFQKLPKGKGKIQRPEQELQIACARWFKLQYPNEIIAHYPAGGGRSKAEAGIFKAMSVLPNVPDLIIFTMRKGYGGLFVELKQPGKKPTTEQFAFMRKLECQGYFCDWTDNIDSFMQIVNKYMILR